MRVLIVGTGQIGSLLRDGLSNYDVRSWASSAHDIQRSHLDLFGTDLIINTAGKTDLAFCEGHPREAHYSNVEVPAYLAGFGLPMIHFSSGCVWDGPYHHGQSGFLPDDKPSPRCYYTWTKALADTYLRTYHPAVHILRPRQVFTDQVSPRNLLVKLLKYEELIDTPNSMTSGNTILRAVRFLTSRLDREPGRIWNVFDVGVTTPWEVGNRLAAAGLRERAKPLLKAKLDEWHSPRRVDTVLEDPLAQQLFQPRNVRDNLNDAIAGLKRNMASRKDVTNV